MSLSDSMKPGLSQSTIFGMAHRLRLRDSLLIGEHEGKKNVVEERNFYEDDYRRDL
jgi:hypothetical protein